LATKELAFVSQRTVSHFLFHHGFFTKSNMAVVPTHSTFFSISPIEILVIEAKSQSVLNSLREHDFQDTFKVAEALGTANTSGKRLPRSRWWQLGQS
jgi:hypothetical protein